MSTLYKHILQIKGDVKHDLLYDWEDLFVQAKEKPLVKSSAYAQFKSIISNALVNTIVDSVKKCKDECVLPDFDFDLIGDMEEEPKQKLLADRKTKTADFFKKAKKKYKNEEEEKKDIEAYNNKAIDTLSLSIKANLEISSQLDSFKRDLLEQPGDYNCEYFEKLYRMKLVDDADLEAKNILLRADLSTSITSKDVEETVKNPKTKKEEKIIKKVFEVTDLTNIEKIAPTIQFLIERQANRICIIGINNKNHSEELNSLKLVAEQLQSKIEHEIQFHNECLIPDFEKKSASEEIPQGTVIMLESLHKTPEEFGSSNVAEKPVTASVSSQVKYAKELSRYGHVYINDSVEDITGSGVSLSDIHSEQNVMGMRLGHEVHAIGEFFMKRTQPCLAIISPDNLKDLLLKLYNMVHITTDIYIEGKSTIQLFGQLKLLSPNFLNIPEAMEITDMINYLSLIIKRAKKYKCQIHFPSSYLIGKIERKVITEEIKGEPVTNADGTVEVPVKKVFKHSWQIQADKLNEVEIQVKSMDQLANYISKFKDKLADPIKAQYKEEENVIENVILDYGESHYKELNDLITKSLRIFVSGDLTTFQESKEVKLSHISPLECHHINLELLEYLRLVKEKQYEKKRLKPVIMICGKNSETSFITSYKVQKEHEKIKKEEERKKLKEQNEDYEEEPQDNNEGEGGKESLNLMIHADVLCIERGSLIDKLLQNQYVKALDRFDLKPERTRDQIEEDLSILEEI